MNYGIPYMGSKSSICRNICALFPKADNFYDLFGGGFSITHCMIKLRSKDYLRFHFNEIKPGISELIKDAIAGKYNYNVFKPKWISREEFNSSDDQYIKICWSFGNNGKNYIFGKDIESYKKSLHNAIVFNEFDECAVKTLGIKEFKKEFSIKDKRFFLRNRVLALNNFKDIKKLRTLQTCEQLEQLQQLEQFQELQQLQRLQQLDEQLFFYNKSYEQIEIKENSIIYCDIPYKSTAEYNKDIKFNYIKFFDWADAQSNPVFISEYNISDSRFKKVFDINKISQMSASSRETKKEKLYINKAGLKFYFKNK